MKSLSLCILLAVDSSRAQPPGGDGPGASEATGASCDACGAGTTYTETVGTGTSQVGVRTITANGCPNHYSICTGKDGITGCGGVGEEGSCSEAKEQDVSLQIPSSPVFRDTVTSVECELGAIAIALNGVSIYSGAVDGQCGLVDVDDSASEWTGFDLCSGHSQATGDYHYHFPPSCLLAQATATNPTSYGHSPQIGWAYDGFPIYGPLGAGGVAVTSADTDECSGIEAEMSSLDDFKYRYYMTGATSDLFSLPANPKPSADDYPFTIKCYKGYTYTELTSGSGGTTGVSSNYTAEAGAGYTAEFLAYGDPTASEATRFCHATAPTLSLGEDTCSNCMARSVEYVCAAAAASLVLFLH